MSTTSFIKFVHMNSEAAAERENKWAQTDIKG
jgi:hypothetical protein